MAALLMPLFAGVLFGSGLVLSQMVDPRKVVGFLDVAGAWDASLALVMVGALVVAMPGYRLAFARGRPIADAKFHLPSTTAIDRRLLTGAMLFGVGWGLAGYCPGPAIASLVFIRGEIFVFVLAMLIGMAAYRLTGDRPVGRLLAHGPG